MKILNLLALTSLLTLPLAAQPTGMTAPSAQADTPVWLEIKVIHVDATSTENGDKDLNVSAKVLRSFKSPTDIKEGDTINIVYHYSSKPTFDPETRRPVGPSSPPLLRNTRETYAFLKPTDEAGVYEPAAGVWSFAPPFGVPQEQRDELGMKAPTPPSAPPSAPPTFRVPMKSPTPPALKAPTTPPAPPATEQETEEGTEDSM